MQTLRQIKNRIRSIENTQKITRAMQMISSVKLTRTKAAFHANQNYSRRLESVLKNIAAEGGTVRHPLLEERKKPGPIALCVIASDAGLCGTYNHLILTRTALFLEEHPHTAVRIIAVGQEAENFFRKKGMGTERSYLRVFGTYRQRMADEIARSIIDLFLSGSVREAYVARMLFSPTLRHRPSIDRFLPVEHPEGGKELHYLAEPGLDAILDRMIPQHLVSRMRAILLESFTAEHSARMFAMKNATDNAAELIDSLTLQRNKARQASITQEVLEIANAAEALKG